MNPDRHPLALDVQQAIWVPSSPDAIEVRVFGTWRGATVPPAVELVVGPTRVAALADAPPAGPAPAWSAAFLAPVEARAALEAGEARLTAGGALVGVPAAVPGPVGPPEDEAPGGTVVDPAVLADRRARRAELAEQSASERAATAEQTVDTLRTQLGHLEERLAGAAAERDGLAARVADAERRLRVAEQREEAERRRRTELEEETLAARRAAEAELEELRGRLAGAEEVASAVEQELHRARRRSTEAARAAEADRAARRELETALADARTRLAALERAGGPDPAEIADLRVRLRAAEAARAETGELRRRLARAEAAAAEAADLRRGLREAQERHADLEARLNAAPIATGREQALSAQVAALEADLARRAAAQDRVQAAIASVREELARVRAQVDAGQAGGAVARAAAEAARSEAAEHRAALEVAHRTVADLQARLEDERRHRAAAEAALARAREDAGGRAELEARVRDLAGEVGVIRRRLREATAELEARLARERLRRVAAEDALVRRGAEQPPAPPHDPEAAPDVHPQTRPDLPPDAGPDVEPDVDRDPAAPPDEAEDRFPSTGDEALDALITGLRGQVASAREQLDAWDAGHGEAPPSPSPAAEAEGPAIIEPSVTGPAPEVPLAGAVDELTRRRLAAIEAELRAAVPDPSAPTPARDVIASLQRAADRLRTAADEEPEALDGVDAPPPDAAPGTSVAEPEPAAPFPSGQSAVPTAGRLEPLGRRAVATGRETAWLRTGLERLAGSERALAADALAALLPAQALVADRLTYDLVPDGDDAVRVALDGGVARVERPPASTARPDAVVSGSLEALVPLAAGGATRRLAGLEVDGSRRKLRRLARARRRPVTLADLAKVTPPADPRLLLAVLASAVEPSWTAGERFGVAWAFVGDGRWSVLAEDGRPLRIVVGDAALREATVHAGPQALPALLAGREQPADRPATVEGDRAAVETLLAWFDRARGVAAPVGRSSRRAR